MHPLEGEGEGHVCPGHLQLQAASSLATFSRFETPRTEHPEGLKAEDLV